MSNLLKTKKSLAIIGGGAWGCALGVRLSQSLNIKLYVRNKDTYLEIKTHRTNNKFLPGIIFSGAIEISNDIAQIQNDKIDYILIAVPAYGVELIAQTIKQLNIADHIPIILASKGIHKDGNLLLDVINQYISNPLLILSGPNIAIEVANNKPTISTIACQNIQLASEIALSFSTNSFSLSPSNLIIHTQLAGCIKNIAAIICGITKVYYFSDNTQAYIILLALNEIIRIASVIDEKTSNFVTPYNVNQYLNAAVVGDLVACCYSEKSRNFAFGNNLAKTDKLARKDFIENYPILVEGKNNAFNLIKLCERFKTFSVFASLLDRIITDPENAEQYIQKLFNKVDIY